MATSLELRIAFSLGDVQPRNARKIVAALGSDVANYDRDAGELQFYSTLLHDVPWKAYELLVDSVQHGRFRHTYDNGTLEMMSPSFDHESSHRFIARLLEALSLQLDVSIVAAGSTTHRKKRLLKGVEPDSSYYVQTELEARQKWLAGEKTPPPDLAIEVDHKSSSMARLPIYVKLGVPELWHYDGQNLQFLQLAESGKYRSIAVSVAFPTVTPDDLLKFIRQRGKKDDTTLVREFLGHMSLKIKSPTKPSTKRRHPKN